MNKKALLQHLKRLPKGDLHNHLTLGISRKRFNTLFPHANIMFPSMYNGLLGMIDVIHNKVNPIMKNREAFELIISGAIEDALEDNVQLLKASIDLRLCSFYENSTNSFCNMIKSLTKKYKGIFYPILGINKTVDCNVLEELYPLCIESGAFYGIDLYGPEQDQNISRFVPIFKKAENIGLLKKVHIGEFTSSHSIEEVILLLNPDEIEHGIRAVDSLNTMSMIKDKGIRLNICPESNLQLGAVDRISNHPIRQLLDFGIDVTVNTDDLLLFNKTISEQMFNLIETNVINLDEAERLLENSLNNNLYVYN